MSSVRLKISKCFVNRIMLVVLVIGSFQISITQDIKTECKNIGKKCVIITDCSSAIKLLKIRDDETLKNMFCGFDLRGPKVCCPIDNPIVFHNDTETATSRSKITTTTKILNKPVATSTEILETTNIPIVNVIQQDVLKKLKVNYQNLPSRKICGLNGSGLDRIYGGTATAIDEFPWIVLIKATIFKKSLQLKRYICSGSLITDRYILTAAHCVSLKKITSVRLGEWDTETEADCQENYCSDHPIDVNISKIIVHPQYNQRSFFADIALLRLEQAVNFTEFIRPICLPNTEYTIKQDYITGTTFWAVGWGSTEIGELSSDIKRKVDLDTVPLEICRNKIPQIQKMINEQNIICAGGKIGKDTCRGDSGGPLMKEITEDFRTNWFLYGITSFGTKQCGTSVPAVYTRVVSYMKWIIENID